MTNGEKIIAILKPRKDQIRIYGNYVEIEIQKLGINFSCELDWWNAECKEPTTKNNLAVEKIVDILGSYTDLDIPYKSEIAENILTKLSSVTPQEPRWIPVSERLPKDLEPVNITWVNRNPESYYANIKDKPFTATGVYFNGQWYWWSTLCTDMLAEYSHNYNDIIDDDIEITAWQPLPQPFEPQESEG